jgi:hypothetical protein
LTPLPRSSRTPHRFKWRLVEGIVQKADAPSAENATDFVQLADFGTFGANEFEESLLESMPRFQADDDEPEE